MQQSVYRWAARVVHRLPLGPGTLGRSLAGRRGAARRWTDWAACHRSSAPLIWVHAASVGEALTAQPVVARLRSVMRDVQVVHTYTSPSVVRWPAPFTAEAADYLPLDEPEPVSSVVEALRPALLAFSRGDLWPELVTAAAARNVPVAILGAGVRPRSRRRHPLLRPLYAAMHGPVSWLGAVSDADAARWIELGIAQDAVEVTGDPRHDQVLERVTGIERLEPLAPWTAGGPTLVAGSVEPTDVQVLLEATRSLLREHPSARLLLVPHAPSDRGVGRLLARCRRRGLGAAPWPGPHGSESPPVLVVTSRGLLSDLYALGVAAYVGGGFRPGRLHATIEPAAYGLPMVVGPEWGGGADAGALVAAGGAVPLPSRRPAEALAQVWLHWLRDESARRQAGLAARASLHQGAALRTLCALLRLMGRGGELGAADQGDPGLVPCGAPHPHAPSGPSTARR